MTPIITPPSLGTVSADALRVSPMLRDLADAELAWLAEHMELIVLEPGDALFSPGDAAEWMYVVMEGSYHVRRETLGLSVQAFVFDTGSVGGVLPFSRMKSIALFGRAMSPTKVARLHRQHFSALVHQIPTLTERIVGALVDRVRESTRRDQQLEKFQALSRLSAGIAHELNNPVAAISSDVAEMARRLAERGRLTAQLIESGLGTSTIRRLDRLSQTAEHRIAIDALERSDCQDEVARWLESVGVEDAWRRAGAFVDAGLEPDELRDALADAPPGSHATALLWLEAGLTLHALGLSTSAATARVARVIDAVKTYTHRDRGSDMLEIDVREGIDSTLALFAERAKGEGVTLRAVHAPQLPRIRAYPGDLNQVWTQLVDNAIDAAPRGGRVEVRTSAHGGCVQAIVHDDGPGVPDDLIERIFEPFFTTKDVGEGTGLGLDVARRIVTDLHGGALVCESSPGDTSFVVRIPINTAATFGA